MCFTVTYLHEAIWLLWLMSAANLQCNYHLHFRSTDFHFQLYTWTKIGFQLGSLKLVFVKDASLYFTEREIVIASAKREAEIALLQVRAPYTKFNSKPWWKATLKYTWYFCHKDYDKVLQWSSKRCNAA